MIPTLTLICHSFWHIIWKYIDGLWYNPLTVYPGFYLAVYLTFYSGILSRIYSGHPIRYPSWHLYLHFLWHSHLACYLAFYLTFSSGILSEIFSDILFWHSVWHIFGDSLWLRSGGELSDPELAVEVRRGTLRSSACSWGPAGSTLILSLLSGFGGERCDLALAVAVGGEHSDPELLFGPGGERCDLAHAVEVNNPHLPGPRREAHKDRHKDLLLLELSSQDLETRTSQELPTKAFVEAPGRHGICKIFMQGPLGKDLTRITTRSSVN